MNPKGKLIVIGGAVDIGSFAEKAPGKQIGKNLNFFEAGILRRTIEESRYKTDSHIEIITTASKVPEIVGAEYLKALESLGATNAHVMHIERREHAMEATIVEKIRKANVVMFTGGDQLRLTSILGGTLLHDLILTKYKNENFVFVGTSAGAAAASNSMIYQGASSEALLKGEVKITSGLGLINDVIIDTHFVQRGRMGRLFQAVVSNPRVLGIGLGEDTGLLISNGKSMEAIGSGLIILVDGRNIRDTNIAYVEMGKPISIKNLVVHVMSKHDHYDIDKHELTIHYPAQVETPEQDPF